MSKKWLMYVVTGLLCCGLIGFAVAKQDNAKRNPNARERAKLELINVQDQILKHGATAELTAKQDELSARIEGRVVPAADGASLSAAAPEGYVAEPATESVADVYFANSEDPYKSQLEGIMNRFYAGEQLSPDEKEMVIQYEEAMHGRDINPLDDQGGPSTFGYQWVDNLNGDTATYVWEESDATWTPLTTINNSDDANATFSWGWNFSYFGVTYTSAFATTNGYIAFGAGSSDFSNDCQRSNGTPTGPAIFGYWDDGHTGRGASSDSGRIVYKDFGDHVTITWDSVGTCCTFGTDILDYQVQLWNTGKIKMQYRQIQKLSGTSTNGASPTIGIQQSNTAGGLDFLTYHCATVMDSAYTNALDGRAVWYFVNLAATGRCCYWNGAAEACAENISFDSCSVLGGSFVIDGTCAGDPCPLGRCCYNGGADCGNFTEEHCLALNGQWDDALTCEANPCPAILQGGETCADRVPLAIGAQIEGTTVGFAIDFVPNCGTALNSSPGVWYSVIGTGNTLTATTCLDALGEPFQYDTKLGIFCGSCDTLVCITGNDDNCTGSVSGLYSTVTWCSELGREYFILVTGFSTASGVYDLLVSDGAACNNPLPCTLEYGRCCYQNGSQCVDTTGAACATLGGVFDADSSCATEPCVNLCALECGPQDIIEVEEFPSCSLGHYDPNGGCNNDSIPPAFQAIQCGDTVCGETWTYQECTGLNFRDTDWYLFTLTDSSDVTVSVVGEFNNIRVGLIAAPCPVTVFIATNLAAVCGTVVSATATCLPPGDYYLWVAPNVFTGVPYGPNREYRAWVNCVPCVQPVGRCCFDGGLSCADNTIGECNLLGGIWDLGLTCAGNPCVIQPDNDECVDAEEIVVVPNGTASVLTGAEGATNTCTDVCDFTSSGPDQFYFFTLTECRLIAIMGDPNDPHLSLYAGGDCCGTAIDCNDDWGNNDNLDLLAWLPPALRPTATFGSMMADTLPAGTYVIRAGHFGAGWQGDYTLSVHDFGPCVISPCDPITDLAIVAETVADAPNNIKLFWTAPQDEDYKVWSTINPNHDGNPDDGADPDWVLEATLLGLTAGPQTWTAPAGFLPYVNYVVTAVCQPFQAPVGRCCYGENLCDDVTEDECTNLGGFWNAFASCANDPCPPPPPANDNCGNAVSVTNGVPVAGTNVNSTTDWVAVCTFDDNDVWYVYNAATTNPVTVSLCEPTYYFDTTLNILDACGAAIEVDCNDDACVTNGLQSEVIFIPPAAGSYWIRVAGFAGATGQFTLTVTQ